MIIGLQDNDLQHMEKLWEIYDVQIQGCLIKYHRILDEDPY